MRRAPLAAALFLTGCAQLPGSWQPETESVEELASRHQYVAALAKLDQQHADDPDHSERRASLLRAADQYREALFVEIDDLTRRGLMAAAQLQLRQALPQIPRSPALERQARSFYATREQFVAAQLAQLTAVRGRNLLQEQPHYEKLIGVDGGPELRAAVKRYREDAAYFAGQLRDAGALAVESGQYEEAVQLLTTANRLHPEKATADLLSAASKGQLAARDRAQDRQQEQRSQRFLDLRSAFGEAMAQEDYPTARRHLDAAERLGDSHAREVAQWRRTLNEAIDTSVTQYTLRGDSRYAEGKVEQALRNWQRAYELRPSTELQGRIERAERLMARYRELRETGPAPSSAVE